MAELNIQQTLQIAVQHHQAGRFQQAEALYRQLLERNPNQPDALHFLGVIAYQSGRCEAAIDLIRKAVALRPNYADAYSNLGNALKDSGQLEEAMAAFRRAVMLEPNTPEAHNNLGIALRDRGQPDEAIASFEQAIRLKPNYAKAIGNVGVALQDKGQIDGAIAAYQKAIACKPDYVEAIANLGNALKMKGDYDSAIAACQHATATKADYPEAWNYLGIALSETGNLDEAINAFRKAIFHRPKFVQAHSNLLFALNYHPDLGPGDVLAETRKWASQHAEPMRKHIRPHPNDRDPKRRLRVGYVSTDFNAHPVGKFLLPLFVGHDKQGFEIFAYAQVRMEDEVTQQLRSHADVWRNIIGLSDLQVAERIRRDKIDILVDLAGHTAGHRLLVFACKPAPVQASYLGYPATTGLETMDYRLTDSLADPPGTTESYFTEQLVRFPHTAWCYQAPPASPAASTLPAMHNDYITFGSFNNFTKVNGPLARSWARILREVPNSQLLLKAVALNSETARKHVWQIMEASGISPDRISLHGSVPIREHLAFYNRIDIGLDTYPYHGTTTTCEALWMGVPVVTLAGQSHVSRVGVSLLTNVGLADLIGKDTDQYIQIAIDLAVNRNRLLQIRQGLRDRMLKSPLMDGAGFVRQIETAYREMWQRWCQYGVSHS
jgi:predicted O-linked N-acetylglucosamine transferase (SPINDLY family)